MWRFPWSLISLPCRVSTTWIPACRGQRERHEGLPNPVTYRKFPYKYLPTPVALILFAAWAAFFLSHIGQFS